MRLYHLSLLLCFLSLLTSSCDRPSSPEESRTEQDQTPTEIAMHPLPPNGVVEQMAATVTQVDYLFYHLPQSMALDDKAAVVTVLRHLDTTQPVPLETGCSSIGRIFYNAGGETLLAGELYYSANCQHIVFLDGETPVFACGLNAAGAAFLKQVGVPQ